SGFGNSCNQPLLAKRPSKIVGSARKTISYLGSAGVPPVFVCESALAQSDFNVTVFAGSAVFGTNPSCKHFRHHDSKSVGALAGAPAVGPPAVGAPAVGAPASCGRFAGILPAPSTRWLPPA